MEDLVNSEGEDKHESRSETEAPSAFHFYSFAHVANNKEPGDWSVEVTLTEKFPFADGEVTSHAAGLDVRGERGDGTPYSSTAMVGKTVKATWMPFSEPNRMTAPDLRRGMTVIIVRMGDSKELFWITMGSNIGKLMRCETVTYVYNADPNGPTKEDLSNAYVFQISTHNKFMMLKTSKANGEVCEWHIVCNGDTGQAYMANDLGDQFLINAKDEIVEMRNSRGTVVQLNGEDIIEQCAGDVLREIGGNVNEIIKGSLNTTVNGPRTLNAKGINHNSTGSSTSTSTGTTSISGSRVDINNG